MRAFLRKLIPPVLLNKYYAFKNRFLLKPHFKFDLERYVKYSRRLDIGEGKLALIIMTAHGIEKGLTMPDFRFGFGQPRMADLILLVNEYLAKFGKEDDQIFDALKIIYEYRKCHIDGGHWEKLPEALRTKINVLLAKYPEVKTDNIQVSSTCEDYFREIDAAFPVFARSRHSVRNFSADPVSLEDMKAAVELARCAPSACNRQPTRVFIVKDKALIAKIFELQGGNKGFGHTVDKLVIMTGSICGYAGATERNWVYVDVGLFAMNLVYALHAKKIGTCILNWNMNADKDSLLRSLVDIPEQDTVVLLIACGKVPDSFKYCRSRRKSIEKYLTVI